MDPNFSSPTEISSQENTSDSTKIEAAENLEITEVSSQENISESTKIESLEKNNNTTGLGVFDSNTSEAEEHNDEINHQTNFWSGSDQWRKVGNSEC